MSWAVMLAIILTAVFTGAGPETGPPCTNVTVERLSSSFGKPAEFPVKHSFLFCPGVPFCLRPDLMRLTEGAKLL